MQRFREHAGPAPQALGLSNWQHFVRRYQRLLYGWLRRSGLPHPDADDVVQEVLAVVARKLPAFRHSRRCGAFRTWLRAILVNRLREFRRARRFAIAGNSPLLDQLADQLAESHCRLTQLLNREHDMHVIQTILELIEPEFRPQTWRVLPPDARRRRRGDGGLRLASARSAARPSRRAKKEMLKKPDRSPNRRPCRG
jgi:RNA polymerase sigma factor (sigma-70 family)